MSLDTVPTFPQCINCKHLDARGRCPAYADIPADIWNNRHDHRLPYPGDGGLRWASESQIFHALI